MFFLDINTVSFFFVGVVEDSHYLKIRLDELFFFQCTCLYRLRITHYMPRRRKLMLTGVIIYTMAKTRNLENRI